MKNTSAAIFFLLLTQVMTGQSQQDRYFKNTIHDTRGNLTFVSIREDANITSSNVLSFINSSFLEKKGLSAKLSKTERDDNGFTHLRFEIASNNVSLANKVILAHLYNGKLVSLNGDLNSEALVENSFQIGESQALNFALDKVKAQKYIWQDRAEEEHMRKIDNDPNFTYFPAGKKVIYEIDNKSYCAWKFDIYAKEPLYRANVYVDASSGAVLNEENLLCTVNTPGSANTKYSGTQTIVCDQVGSTYRLRESTRGQGVETYNMNNGTSFSSATDFSNSTSSWNNTGFDQGAHDAHWGAEATYDYYKNVHNRNSIDNAGFKLRSYVHYNSNYSNAFWDGSRIAYGDGGGSMDMFAALDVCGHEITHGLTGKTAGLVYQNESGALNESFSDIFGVTIEKFARPGNWNWKMGEDLDGWGLRNMQNPNQMWQPDTYLGTQWYTGSGDNGGVHTNSGVGNYWYYILSNGGTGTNDKSQVYSVNAIGMASAAKIAFRALTVYFTPNTDYANARILTIEAAKDLFGVCSNEVIQTANAWHAVGVGNAYSAVSTGANFFAGSTIYCSLPATVNFTNITVNGTSFYWEFGDGATSTASNVAHTYTAAGSYNVKMAATGCSGTDTVSRVSYINIGSASTPVVSDITGCLNNTITLNATGNASILWYDSPTSPTVIATGSQYSAPTPPANTTYYVSNTFTSPALQGGMPASSTGAFLVNNGQYLVFDVLQNSTLHSVVVDAQIQGNRTFQLRNSANTVLSTITTDLTVGINTVNLNFTLTPGFNYRLGLANNSLSSMKRTSTGVSYPYKLGNSVHITGSSASANTYIYFYDWKVSTSGCSSPRVPVNVYVNPLPDVYVFAPISTVICAGDAAPIDVWPYGGTLSGAGMINSTFNSAGLGSGLFEIEYLYTDTFGCSNSAKMEMEVQECVGIEGNARSGAIEVYPNPANDHLVIRNAVADKSSYVLTDATGRIIHQSAIGSAEQQVPVQRLAAGVYFIRISDSGQQLKTIKVIKQ
jgi:Zn-dependent metalloprotease